MLGIIEASRASSCVCEHTCAGISLVQLKLKNLSHPGKWIKRLRKYHVNTVAMTPEVYENLKGYISRCGMKVVTGYNLKCRLVPEFSAKAIADEGFELSSLAVEIFCHGEYAFNAVRMWSKYVRYIFVCGRCSGKIHRRAAEELGVSVVLGRAPEALYMNTLTLYPGGRNDYFTVRRNGCEKSFIGGEVILPEVYSGICGHNTELAFAEMLMSVGAIDVDMLEINRVFVEKTGEFCSEK